VIQLAEAEELLVYPAEPRFPEPGVGFFFSSYCSLNLVDMVQELI